MIDSSRSATAPTPQPTLAYTALALIAGAIALITLALSLTDSLGTPAFLALIGAELLLVAGMGALFGTVQVRSTTATTTEDAAAKRLRDEATLDALEPLRGGEQR
ncbi:hypothetical protein IPZ58_13195 [Streptomyces roseoverticillatus]|uniref:hypothetical protein n=1 Tax=Streptomyces roseoverticillatus TaxID=66429 RepID=UPI001F3C319E|nr:hypothetical protein [Streptomyces roseoverticillatus]MCF3102535.1 hypothetical protein [Streptomyces roseoverticillatus]